MSPRCGGLTGSIWGDTAGEGEGGEAQVTWESLSPASKNSGRTPLPEDPIRAQDTPGANSPAWRSRRPWLKSFLTPQPTSPARSKFVEGQASLGQRSL